MTGKSSLPVILLGIFSIILIGDCKLNSGDGSYDMVLMIDRATGVEGRKNLATAIIQRLNVSPTNDRLALYAYAGDDFKVFYELNGPVAPSKADALKKVAGIKKKMATRKSDMFPALNTAASDSPSSIMAAKFLRTKSKKALVFVASSGASTTMMTQATKALKQLKNKGIKVYMFDYNRGANAKFVNALVANGGTHIPFSDTNIGPSVAKLFG